MDDGFYNLSNEYITVDKLKETLINYYKDLNLKGKTKIDDFNEGSEIMNLIGLMSVISYNMLYELNRTLSNHFINTAEGEFLDLIGNNPNINLERITGSNATGFVKFTISEPSINEIEIPEGTIVGSSEASYSTIEDNYIPIGETSVYCQVEAEVEGTEGNCEIGAITECEDPQFTVINDEAFIDGFETEEDEEYRTRLLEYVRMDNFGSIGYYENVLLNFDNVHDILKVESQKSASWYINIVKNTLDVYSEILSYFNDANNYVMGHDFSFLLPEEYTLSYTITVPSDCPILDKSLIEYGTYYFIGGNLTDYPVFLRGLDIDVVTSNDEFISKIKEDFTEINSIEISDIVCSFDGTTEEINDFDEISTSYHFVYRIDEISVVRE